MNDYLVIKELYHSGIKGQKWGIRRYQNEDGTLTEAGKARYGIDSSKSEKDFLKQKSKYDKTFDKYIKMVNLLNKHFLDKNVKKNINKYGEWAFEAQDPINYFSNFEKKKILNADARLRKESKKIVDKYGEMAVDDITNENFKKHGYRSSLPYKIVNSYFDKPYIMVVDTNDVFIRDNFITKEQKSNLIKKHKEYYKQAREQAKKQLDKFNKADSVEKKKIIKKIKDRIAYIYVGEHMDIDEDLAKAFKNSKYYKKSGYYDYSPDVYFRDFDKFVRETVSIYDMILQSSSKAARLKNLKPLANDPKITEEKFIKKYLENIYETSLTNPEKIAMYYDMFEY